MKRWMKTTLASASAATLLLVLGATQTDVDASFQVTGGSLAGGMADFKVNPNFPASAGTAIAQETAMVTAASNWTLQSNAAFAYNYAGLTASTTIDPTDADNIIFFSPVPPAAGVLALTTVMMNGSTIAGFDITMYGSVSWHATNPGPTQFDIEGIATHEFGHGLGLAHDTCDPNATMSPFVSAGASSVSKRSLEANDIAGVESIYGVTTGAFGACGAGNLGTTTGAGGPFDIVLVNGAPGNARRVAEVGLGMPVTIEVVTPPVPGTPTLFTLFGRAGTPTSADELTLGFGIGTMCFTPCPVQPGNPLLFTLADNLGVGGCAPLAGSIGTPFLLSLPAGIPVPAQFALQALVFEPGAPANLAISNAVLVDSDN